MDGVDLNIRLHTMKSNDLIFTHKKDAIRIFETDIFAENETKKQLTAFKYGKTFHKRQKIILFYKILNLNVPKSILFRIPLSIMC